MIIKDRKFLIYGVGKTGISLAKFITKSGGRVAIYDKKMSDVPIAIANIGVENRCGHKKKELFSGIHAMILSPGVSIYDEIVKTAILQKVCVMSEMDFSMQYLSGVKIGITASGGKSTTTKLVYEMLKWEHSDVRIGGNYGIPICQLCENSNQNTISVLEISSFMLEQSKSFHFDIVAFLNISKNHLDRHKTMAKYLSAKCKISKNLTPQDVLILPNNEEKIKMGILKNLKNKSLPKLEYFDKYINIKVGAIVSNGKKSPNRIEDGWVKVDNKEVVKCEQLKMCGKHNFENLLVACTIAKQLGVTDKTISQVCENFQPLPHRFEKVSTKNGVTYINDSKATSGKSAETTLDIIDFPAVLMIGGSNKNDSFYDLFEKINKNPRIVKVVIYGEVSGKIQSHAKAVGYHNYEKCKDFTSAFNMAKSICACGTSLVLLPACPSFDEFENFERRGDKFKKLVEEICEN